MNYQLNLTCQRRYFISLIMRFESAGSVKDDQTGGRPNVLQESTLHVAA